MVTDTDGIILKQTKIPGDRRMLILLTRKYGKISAGTSIKLNGKNKSALALRVFTHGTYEIFQGRNSFNINAAETKESYFALGEDIDKYMIASYILELTEKMLPEKIPNESVLDLLIDFMRLLAERKKNYKTLVIVYQWKLLSLCGYRPLLESCARCGNASDFESFSIVDGGLICKKCINSGKLNRRLLYSLKFDIINVLKFIDANDIKLFSKLVLNDDVFDYLNEIFREYISYHLDIDKLKSENYLNSD